MKKIYIFDIDNTIYSTKHTKIFPQTIKLLSDLKKNPDNILGYATGRGSIKLGMLKQIDHFFDIKILINGALVYYHDQEIVCEPIAKKDVSQIVDEAFMQGISVGMVSKDGEAVSIYNEHIKEAYVGYLTKAPLIDPKYYLNHDIFQLWFYHKDRSKIVDFTSKYPHFNSFNWHAGGLDLLKLDVSKASAIKAVLKQFDDVKLICIGDGHNDLEMVRMADIGIAIENNRDDEIKRVAKLIAPPIEEDKLDDFFTEHNLK